VIACAGMGVAVRSGAPKRDISSVDAFKRRLLDAKSIAYAPEGMVGAHVVKVFERLGIVGEMKAKMKPQPSADRTAQAVVNGEVDLAFVGMSTILSARGAELLGPFPSELQDYVVYVVGIGSTADSAGSIMKAKGMEPAAQ
jgi:molybdate transport system substrate-binding protein